MEGNKQITHKVIHISRKKIVWTIVVLAILYIVGWGALNFLSNTTGIGGNVPMSGMRSAEMIANSNAVGYGGNGGYPGMTMPPYPYPDQGSSYKDDREFLKTNYNAQIRTRKVANMVRDVKNAVRDAEGRIDNMSSSEKNGYVSFVVPKSRYDAFKDDIESLAHEKLISISESSTNLLGQKQQIEAQGEQIDGSLASLTKAKTALTAKHNQVIANLDYKIKMTADSLAATRAQYAEASNQVDRDSLKNSENFLIYDYEELLAQKKTENNKYAAEARNYDSQIAIAKTNKDANIKQDENFTDNIETVNGTVNVNWISLLRMAVIFSPIHPTIIAIILALAILFYLNKRGYIPKVMFV